MTLGLNVLNHLGLNLYSNIPAVLSEVVANAWDADAENVDVEIDKGNSRIVITDDGHGMNEQDINGKYLYVGYRKRDNPDERITPKWGRLPMGRKGIGKLSLFSIARLVEVHTVKDGVKSGFVMRLEKIQEKITNHNRGDIYNPEPIDPSGIRIDRGTQIILTDLKKTLHQAIPALRKRLARRFSVIGEDQHFAVRINGDKVGIADRDYFHKVQHIWFYGEKSRAYSEQAPDAEHRELRPAEIPDIAEQVHGWIGTVKVSGDLKDEDDNLNKIVLMVRGKLAQEDVLEDFNEGGIYTKYLIGEINADFLDLDNKDDIATSSRQKIIEDDPRYQALKKFVYIELKHIQNSWSGLRDKEGTIKALEVPAIKDWFRGLSKDDRKRAGAIFGKINRAVDSPEDKKRLMKYSVLAFESLRYKGNLDALERISPENLEALVEIFESLDDIEATLYHQIVRERIEVIKILQEKVEENAREKAVQQHLFTHLWLLDPSWERATETPRMEQSVAKEFAGIDANLTDEEREGRVDIRYTTTSGKHVIVELKRAGRRVSSSEIVNQVSKYRNALRKVLREASKSNEPIEVVCVVGRELVDWDEENGREESAEMLAAKGVRVVMYQELIDNAYRAYKRFLEKSQETGRVFNLIKSLDEDGVLFEPRFAPAQDGGLRI